MRAWALVLLSLGACRDGSTEPETQEDPDDSASTDSSEPESSTPWYSAEDLAQIILSLADMGLPHARALRDSYQSLMENGDDDCPGSLTEIVGDLKGCTAESGWYYGGLLTYVVEQSTLDGALMSNFWTDTCDFQIVDPEGQALIGGGDMEARYSADGGFLVSSSIVKGSWIWPLSEHSWLAQGMSTDLAFRLESEAESGDSLNLWGTLGTEGIDIYIDNLFFGQNCSGQVSSGSVWIRQADGTWYELAWDDDCSGCFKVRWDFQEELGEACVDLSSLKDSVVAELEIEP